VPPEAERLEAWRRPAGPTLLVDVIWNPIFVKRRT